MTALRHLVALLLLLVLAGCGGGSKFKTYEGLQVTRVIVSKEDRQLFLMHHDRVLEDYDVGLGWAPEGHKRVEGDGRTPEGNYLIDKRNPNSSYHLSIGVSYPNRIDRANAEVVGMDPGGNIFIHGRGPLYQRGMPPDWTWGCIAVTDREMEQIYAMVPNGTPITILP